MERTFDIMFKDLKRQTQHELLKMMGISSPRELNWDTVPLAQIVLPELNDGDQIQVVE